MRRIRAAVIVVVGVAAVLFAPGVATADSGTALQDCDRIWLWWIPMPCLSAEGPDDDDQQQSGD